MKYFFVTFVLFLLWSCSFYTVKQEIKIKLPQYIPQLLVENDFSWTLETRTFTGQIDIYSISSFEKSITVDVSSGLKQAFLLYPLIDLSNGEELRLYPAGFLYKPFLVNEVNFVFEWQNGFVNYLLFQIGEFQSIEKINIVRLLSRIKQVSNQKNHWNLDDHRIIENILDHKINAYSVKKNQIGQLDIRIPLGEWLNTNTLDKNLISNGKQYITEANVNRYPSYYLNKKEKSLLIINMSYNGSLEYIINNY